MNSPEFFSSFKPRKSFTCVLKMTTAISAVKPAVTGNGMNLIIVPMRANPIAMSIAPAKSVQMARLANP